MQRWRQGRATYRPAGEVIDPRAFEVSAIDDDRSAKRFIEAHHYSASYPAARFRFGLFERGELVGVAVFSQPCNDLALRPLPPSLERTELGRFALLDRVKGNGETWFLARAFELLKREGIGGVVSFSDPMQRVTTDGRIVLRGHVGTIYQAFNGVYLGRARSDTLRMLPDGRVLHNRALAKVRKRDKGWRYVVEQIVSYGAPPPSGDLATWLAAVVPTITRKVKHPGNHKYCWAFDRRVMKDIEREARDESGSRRAYPKGIDIPRAA